MQSSCNYVTLFLRNAASLLSESTTSGTSLRFSLVAIDDVLGGEAVPSSRPYTTPVSHATAEHGPLHVNPYPNTDSPGDDGRMRGRQRAVLRRGGGHRQRARKPGAEDRATTTTSQPGSKK